MPDRGNHLRLLLLTLLVLNSGPAYAEWVALGESDSGTTVYVDRDTRLPKEKLVKMWILYNFTRVRTVAGESYFSNKVHREYDCAQARHRTLVDMRFSSDQPGVFVPPTMLVLSSQAG